VTLQAVMLFLHFFDLLTFPHFLQIKIIPAKKNAAG